MDAGSDNRPTSHVEWSRREETEGVESRKNGDVRELYSRGAGER